MATKSKIDSLKLRIASLTGRHIEMDAKEVYVDMDHSMIGVLPLHQPEFYKFHAAVVTAIDKEGKEEKCILYDGFIEIEPDQVAIAANELYKPGEITHEDVQKRLNKMKEEIGKLLEEEDEKKVYLEKEIEKIQALLEKILYL